MIFDLTRQLFCNHDQCSECRSMTRMKPRNKASCTSEVLVGGQVVGALSHLSVVQTDGLDVIGGRFTLAWHRLAEQPFAANELTLRVIYTFQGQTHYFTIPDVQIVHEGCVMIIESLDELLGIEVPFFAKTMETRTVLE